MRRVGRRFRRYAKFLKGLKDTKSDNKRLKMLEKAGPGQIFAIIDAAHNILNGHFPITPQQKRRLLPYRNIIRHLGRAKTYHNARNIIQQGRGIFLNALLAPILAELGSYAIRKVIKRFTKSDTESTTSSTS